MFGNTYQVILLSVAALIVVRLMGNRTVGQLSPFDFVIMVGIGDIIITASMDRTHTMTDGLEGLLALLVLQQVLAYLSLKSVVLRKWFEGKPVILIQDGRLIRENFARTRFNYDDLRQELHRQGMDMQNLKDIKLARLESCGVFSIIRHDDCEPLTKADFYNFFQTVEDNPLSPLGAKMSQVTQFMADVHFLAAQVKEQQGKYGSQ